MANPNPEIWGNSSSWIYSTFAYGLTSDLSKIGNFDKPKVNNFGGTDNVLKTTLVRARGRGFITKNDYIDETLCPCGQAPDISPFAKIAIFNENNDLSTTPRIYEITDSNINWFFADRVFQTPTNSSYSYSAAYYNASHLEYSLGYQQFAPKMYESTTSDDCVTWQLSPYVYYGIKSLLLSIQVRILPPDTSNPTGGTWVTLDDWKNNYPTYSCIGLRLFVRNCTAYNSEQLTYNNSGGISEGQASYLCVTNPIPVINNGEMTPTQFLTQYTVNSNSRCAYIFDVTPQIYNYNDYRRGRAVLPCWDYFDNQTVHTYYGIPSDPVRYYYYKIPYSENTYNKIMSIAALFGCYFTPTNKYQFDYNMLDNDLYLTVLDDNGVAHGQYTHGADNANNPLYSKASIRDIDYNPDTPPTPVDPNTYSNVTGFNSISAGASATERYVLDAGNTRQLLSDLWTISHDIAGVDYDNYDYKILDSFLVTNPIDCIISLKRFPFSIPHTFSAAKTPVNLGKNHGSAEGYLTYNVFNTVQFAGINIFPRFGNSFLDYAPYTEYELYVPFCGTVKLNAGDILGHTLNCRLQIDLITGACTAYIMADSLVIETMTGTVSCELALTGIDSATIDANIQNSVLNHVNARTNKETSMLSPLTIGGLGSAALNPFKTAGNITTAKTELHRAEYELTHIQTQPHTMGTAGGLTGWYQEFNARLMIYYPEGDVITSAQPPELKNLTSYGHTTGFATIDNAVLSNYSGFTVATNAILNFAATTTEKDMIESALNGGIFI